MVLTLATPIRGGPDRHAHLHQTLHQPHPGQRRQRRGEFYRPRRHQRQRPERHGQAQNIGRPRVGELLTADKGTIADPNGLTKADAGDTGEETGFAYQYQWIRVDGATETDISGATAKTYTPTAADEGKQVRVRVSFKDDADTAEALVSDAVPDTGSILPMAACEAPTYTGGAEEIWSGELTMGNDSQNASRFGFDSAAVPPYGMLTPNEFTLGSADYTIEGRRSRRRQSGRLFYAFTVDIELPAADVPRLVLYDCDTPLALYDQQ